MLVRMHLSTARPAQLLSAALLLAALANAAPATATPKGPSSGAKVVRDCTYHGSLTHRYPLSQLRAAVRGESKDLLNYSTCGDVINTAIAAITGPAGRNTAGAVFADCHANGGALTHRYRLATLRRARHLAARRHAHQVICRPAISTQIHTLS